MNTAKPSRTIDLMCAHNEHDLCARVPEKDRFNDWHGCDCMCHYDTFTRSMRGSRQEVLLSLSYALWEAPGVVTSSRVRSIVQKVLKASSIPALDDEVDGLVAVMTTLRAQSHWSRIETLEALENIPVQQPTLL